MEEMAADFSLGDSGSYSVFVYSERDEIVPFLVELEPDQTLTIFDRILSYSMLSPYASGRVMQDEAGVLFVKEHSLRA